MCSVAKKCFYHDLLLTMTTKISRLASVQTSSWRSFDWNQIERAKSLGVGRLELADLEPFAAVERTILLSHDKHGEQGRN